MNKEKNKNIVVVLNALIVLFSVIGITLMMVIPPQEDSLQATGLENFRYYTVLSNVFCGIVALVQLVFIALKKDTNKLIPLKLGAVCATTITFCVVAFFFGPLYGLLRFYRYGNLFFHLIEPVIAVVEFLYTKKKRIPFIYAFYSAIPTFIYGICYGLNIVINGMDDPWPYNNDFYGFLNWGWGVGITILLGVTFLAFILACIFRKICNSRADT